MYVFVGGWTTINRILSPFKISLIRRVGLFTTGPSDRRLRAHSAFQTRIFRSSDQFSLVGERIPSGDRGCLFLQNSRTAVNGPLYKASTGNVKGKIGIFGCVQLFFFILVITVFVTFVATQR